MRSVTLPRTTLAVPHPLASHFLVLRGRATDLCAHALEGGNGHRPAPPRRLKGVDDHAPWRNSRPPATLPVLWTTCREARPASLSCLCTPCNAMLRVLQTVCLLRTRAHVKSFAANSAMCYPRHARAGTKESTQIDQPCSQWRGCKALKPALSKLVEKLCSNRVKHLAQP